MNSPDIRNPPAGSSSPPVVTPHYTSSLPNPPGDSESSRQTRCVTGPRFIGTIHGILNIIIIVSRLCFFSSRNLK